MHAAGTDGGGSEIIKISSSPPSHVSDKAMVFLKCSHASKLTRENLPEDVMYSGMPYNQFFPMLAYVTPTAYCSVSKRVFTLLQSVQPVP